MNIKTLKYKDQEVQYIEDNSKCAFMMNGVQLGKIMGINFFKWLNTCKAQQTIDSLTDCDYLPLRPEEIIRIEGSETVFIHGLLSITFTRDYNLPLHIWFFSIEKEIRLAMVDRLSQII
jgi:hypothetical protein